MTDAREQRQMPQDLAAVLSQPWPKMSAERLRDTLYTQAFTRQLKKPLRLEPRNNDLSSSDLVQQLSTANQGHDRWEHGWQINEIDALGGILAVKGPHLRYAKVGEYALTHCQTIAPRVGMAASVFFSRESVTLQTGVYYALGESLPSPEDQKRPLRLYFNIDAAGLTGLYSYITHTLNDAKIPFTLKTMLESDDRDRADATVLYIPKRYFEQLNDLAEQLPASVGHHFRSYTPLCTKPLRRGVGLAESPGNGESFGMHRCRLIAEGLVEAQEANREDVETRRAIVKHHFARSGININSPHCIQNSKPTSQVRSNTVLNEHNIVRWLSRKRLFLEADMTSDRFRVTRSSSRNHNFSLQRTDGAGYFVKQLRVHGRESTKMMAREAAVYAYFRHAKVKLTELSPLFYDYVTEDNALILQRLPQSHSVTDLQLKGYPIEIAVAAAKTLGQLHTHNVNSLTYDLFDEHFELNPPGIYTAHQGGPLLNWLSHAQMQIIERVKGHKHLAQALDELSENWRATHLIHGDVKWENSIWTTTHGTTSNSLKWVDWELSDLGDPHWDAGCFIQAYLSHWTVNTLASMPDDKLFTVSQALAQGNVLKDAMQPSLNNFVKTYAATMRLSQKEKITIIGKLMQCAAARLIQMSLEVMHGMPRPTRASLALFEIAAHIVEHNSAMSDYFVGALD